jgi:YegS/Rv2252/BmrU family lipid kinase
MTDGTGSQAPRDDERLHVIFNPRSAGGRTAARWPQMKEELEKRFAEIVVSETYAPFSGEPLARQALEGGADLILAIGGDGTFSECANGFFKDGAPVNPNAELAFLTSGSGCDMRKTFNWPMPEEIPDMLDLIKSGKTRKLDVGHMTYQTPEGTQSHRYFVNITSFGLGGAVSSAVNRSRIAKMFGGSFAFSWHSFVQGLLYKNQKVRLQIDDDFDETLDITLAVIANCQYFGGGMHIAPNADPEDGLFDILIGHSLKKSEFSSLFAKVGSGAHIDHPKIIQRRARKIIATPLDAKPVRHDVDGEAPGALPSTFTILPQVIKVRG